MNEDPNGTDETLPLVSKYLAKLRRAIKNKEEEQDTLLNQENSSWGLEQYAFRGQASCCWDLQSTTSRRHEGNLLPEEFIEYNCNLVDDAKGADYHRKENKKLADIEMLAELRHYFAATALIDFTRDFLIALWFACESVKGDNNCGKVFIVDISDADKFIELTSKDKEKTLEEILTFQTRKSHKKLEENASKQLRIGPKKPELWYWEPRFKINHRLSSQKGVFIFGKPVLSKKDLDYGEIAIQVEDKGPLRSELLAFFDVSETNLFNDFHGFAGINDANHKIRDKTWIDYLKAANTYFQQGKWEKAIEQYNKFIESKNNEPFI